MVDWQKALFDLSDVKVLLYLNEKPSARYSELLSKVVTSRSTLASSLGQLQKKELIFREIKDTRPLQTTYGLTEKGKELVRLLLDMKRLLDV